MPETVKNEFVEVKKEKKEGINNSEEKFKEKVYNPEQVKLEVSRKKEAEEKKSEGDPDKNLNLALDYPTEKDVGDWLIDTLKSLKDVQDVDKRNGLKSMIKHAHDSINSGDLNLARQDLSFVNDKVKELNSFHEKSSVVEKNEKKDNNETKEKSKGNSIFDAMNDDKLMDANSTAGLIAEASKNSGKTQKEILGEIEKSINN